MGRMKAWRAKSDSNQGSSEVVVPTSVRVYLLSEASVLKKHYQNSCIVSVHERRLLPSSYRVYT